MKKLMVGVMLSVGMFSGLFLGSEAQAKLSDQQSMKCIDGDTQTKSAFQDLQAAYEMRIVTAKDFFKVMEKPSNCPQLRKDLKKLHSSAIASLPRAKSGPRMDYGSSSGGGYTGPSSGGFENAPPAAPEFGDFPPPPPPMPDSDFGDDFSDFR